MPYDLKQLAKQAGVRRRLTLRPIPPPRGMEAQYRSILRAMLREIRKHVDEVILPEVERERSALTTDAIGDRLESLFVGMRRLVERLTGTARGMTERIFEAEADRHTDAFARSIRSAIGIDMRDILRSSPGLEEKLSVAALRNAQVITGLADDTQKRIAETITRNLQQGGGVTSLRKELVEAFGMEDRRAQLIARNEVANINSQLNEFRQEEAGVTEYIWRASNDERTRPLHAELDGTRHRWDRAGPDDGMHPGEPINCLPSDAPVRVQSNIERLFRRRHAGEATLLVFDAGEPLKTTPNHPVLTHAGWKPAKLVDIGDYLIDVRFGGAGFLEMDVEQREPRIGDLFELVSAINTKDVARVLGGHFHGDAGVDDNIDVVSIEGALRLDGVPPCDEFFAQRILEKALVGFTEFAGYSFLDPILSASRLPTDGVMRLAGELETFLWAQALHPKPVGIAAISQWYADTLNVIGYSLPSAAVDLSQGEDAFTGLISSDHLVAIKLLRVCRWAIASLHVKPAPSAEGLAQSVSVISDLASRVPELAACFDVRYRPVKGVFGDAVHDVYNLESANNWFIAHGRVVHNCRCTAQAVIELD